MRTEPDSIANLLPKLITLRRDIHAHPELAYAEQRTAGIVAASLRMLGLEVEEGIGGTGIVGLLRLGSNPAQLAQVCTAAPQPSLRLQRPGIGPRCGLAVRRGQAIAAAIEPTSLFRFPFHPSFNLTQYHRSP